jgi:hypothetical protein
MSKVITLSGIDHGLIAVRNLLKFGEDFIAVGKQTQVINLIPTNCGNTFMAKIIPA